MTCWTIPKLNGGLWKITYKWSIFQQAMFDYQRVYEDHHFGCQTKSRNGKSLSQSRDNWEKSENDSSNSIKQHETTSDSSIYFHICPRISIYFHTFPYLPWSKNADLSTPAPGETVKPRCPCTSEVGANNVEVSLGKNGGFFQTRPGSVTVTQQKASNWTWKICGFFGKLISWFYVLHLALLNMAIEIVDYFPIEKWWGSILLYTFTRG